MGLMLSVLVFCVGVAEILDCWHHFLLHLVQPQYNPLPSHLNLKSDYLSDREILNPLSESRRTSNVDICWPKDLSPDDIHVIKKRPQGEGDPDSPPRVVRKHLHEKDTSPFPASHKNVESFTPDIVVHTPEPSDTLISPAISRETSPNRLELGVIVESDSSSEVDEPSQIENLNYNKGKDYECIEHEEELSDLCHDGSLSVGEVSRPRCPSAKILEEEWENESVQKGSDIEKSHDSETSSLPDLPVFTDDILSHDVTRVNVHHPTNSAAINLVEPSCGVIDDRDSKIKICKELNTSKSEPFERSSSVQPISSLLDEGLEPIPEFPEIKIQESLPVPQADNSDSSVNTSDASWMVRSKTSDRPLVIRFDTSPEKVQQDFQSVVQTDLRALGDKELLNTKGSPSRPLEKVDSVDVYYDALIDQNGEDRQVKYQDDVSLEESPKHIDKFYNGIEYFDADAKPSSVNFMQIDSNSSSSSLSGVPPLPEDTLESLTQTSLPTDNCFSQTSEMLSMGISYSQSDNRAISFSTSETSDSNILESSIPDHQRSCEIESVQIDQIPNTQSVKGINISESENIRLGTEKSCEAISSMNYFKKETENISVSPNSKNEKRIPEHIDSSDDVMKEGKPLVLEGSLTGLNNIDGSSSTKSDSGVNHSVSFCQENIASDSNLETIRNTSSTIDNQKTRGTESEHTKTSNSLDKLMPKDLPVKKDESNVTLDSTQSDSSFEAVPHSLNKDNDKTIIPTNSQENRKPIETQKGTLPKASSSKKHKTKSPSKNSSSDSNDTVVLCCAKQSDEEKREENRASAHSSASVKTNLTNDSVSKTEPPVKAGPSKPTEEVKPSTSKSEEDKAFWLIFSGEYTKAMNKDWHSGHFCCWQCDESLTGQRYVLRDEHPYCVKCYESVFANGCEECSKTIGIDSKDLSYKDKHWHEACFLCNKCRVSLVDKQFGSKLDKIFCGNCYDQQFASRCDGCGQIFKAGTKKMEYKTRQWHEPCFACCVCKSPIGTKSFIPREQEIYCATCYEEKFATRCVKCNKIITSGGVTYKNEPWHRECFTCTNCNTSLAGQRFTSRDEKPYCAECFGELFAKRCTACSKPITGIGGTRFISFEDRHWHNDCFICASCKTSLVGRGFITDADDIICPECAKQKLM